MFFRNEVKVSCTALKKKDIKKEEGERNRTFPRQRGSRTLVSSDGPPAKREQSRTCLFRHVQPQMTPMKAIRIVFFDMKVSGASTK